MSRATQRAVAAHGRTRAERDAAVADVLAAAYRSGTIEPADALRIIRHDLRRRQTNRKLAIPTRSAGAHRVIESYAERGVPVPNNGSNDALHADHVHPLTIEHLETTITLADWLGEPERLGEVVCVTAAENCELEGRELAGVTGPAKNSGMSLVDQRGQPGPTQLGGAQLSNDERGIAALFATPWAPDTGKGLLLSRDGEPQLRTWQTGPGGSASHDRRRTP